MSLTEKLQHKIDFKTKPLGALGQLESIALQIGQVFNTLTPEIRNPHILVFAADHGIAREGVSAYPAEVTPQMVLNFVNGGAAINVFSKQNELTLEVIDAGVNFDFDNSLPIIHQKVAKGTQSFLEQAAMSVEQFKECLQKGRQIVQEIHTKGSNCVGFGEMGIGNTATSAVLMSILTEIPIQDCVGSGTGVVNDALDRKTTILKTALQNYKGSSMIDEKLAHFGGFEIYQMAGGMLQAFENNMLILVDGFISSVAFLVAYTYESKILKNAIFCHCSQEKAHKNLLHYLKGKPLLDLGLRLGEGTGIALAFPIIQGAVNFLNQMASFEEAGVSESL
ncbi:nicotinate-nucleotide--dimethylbenzimidazole phosphoribosyltransferase [Flavobacterium columnare NBRC 100251 = ATCC 23463]|uniref:Nicotinate-nucleotide--dimethylbenzimidazole phosphoribosyltransferase n=1 Tax=Flavobacterium columnare (strain ATCC 49512 / CIP 103533 / TG 44/87) TaxID=1041826 RepID=G8X8K5_FLACA|nr:nicotinate-nucleotide--dimethylbenzimidazole phosphoribosyltransferase [Flavobacterium columnare]AEW85839.1 bifunctional cob(II)yrinic acid a,c-diamide reductase/nicotinate-nucleotide--dimethylbenzimidazole phosphoribosyltransferase [Flavobacterium columnare ATCC 49512]MBF6654705.1 nicotinate-nucleotide--dimethylbenzimidazole phosphoribosyltransferase [Flavobacterium columnare]OOB81944.1 nicotinate-nucleotide--dimethylbenzimidazole phosphoribosyltransferase [Flavobacterium columnare]PDS22820